MTTWITLYMHRYDPNMYSLMMLALLLQLMFSLYVSLKANSRTLFMWRQWSKAQYSCTDLNKYLFCSNKMTTRCPKMILPMISPIHLIWRCFLYHSRVCDTYLASDSGVFKSLNGFRIRSDNFYWDVKYCTSRGQLTIPKTIEGWHITRI